MVQFFSIDVDDNSNLVFHIQIYVIPISIAVRVCAALRLTVPRLISASPAVRYAIFKSKTM